MTKAYEAVVLGGGVTGLAAGAAGDLPVFEAEAQPGGICSSYYLRPGDTERLWQRPSQDDAYQFEIGGGHWIFGGDAATIRLIDDLAACEAQSRLSAVFFARTGTMVPFPLQDHFPALGPKIARQVLDELLQAPRAEATTMNAWLMQSFGPTLNELFFAPFHEKYTAGLWTRIAPQDAYKSPIDRGRLLETFRHGAPPAGYNVTFRYPRGGLDVLVARLAARSRVHCAHRAVAIDVEGRRIGFANGTEIAYQSLISTLPLDRTLEIASLDAGLQADPYTSVLVLNIGARRGPKCPEQHWLYVPDSASGFYRVGFYSHVSAAFLPSDARTRRDRVSIYVERAWIGGQPPDAEEVRRYGDAVVAELRAWGFIEEVDVVDPTWVESAYTWTKPGSTWRTLALQMLEDRGIRMVGRYARWHFQGIADSIRDGLLIGTTHRVAGKGPGNQR